MNAEKLHVDKDGECVLLMKLGYRMHFVLNKGRIELVSVQAAPCLPRQRHQAARLASALPAVPRCSQLPAASLMGTSSDALLLSFMQRNQVN